MSKNPYLPIVESKFKSFASVNLEPERIDATIDISADKTIKIIAKINEAKIIDGDKEFTFTNVNDFEKKIHSYHCEVLATWASSGLIEFFKSGGKIEDFKS